MKKRKKTKKNDSATSARRLPALIALALVVVVIGAISALSRQLVAGKQSQPQSPEALRDSSSKSYRTVKVAGQDVQVDPQTGKLKPLTPQEAQALAAGLKKMLNKSAEGLTEVQNADGSTTMDLEGRFRHVVVAREREDGSLSTSCVDNPRQAASAMGIDPKLFGIDDTPGATKQNQKTRQRN